MKRKDNFDSTYSSVCVSVWVCKGYSGAQAVTGLVWGFKLILGKARKAKLGWVVGSSVRKERRRFRWQHLGIR